MSAPVAPPPAPIAAASPTARIVALADQCVLCGLCLPHCPTYRLDRTESESPRGRIMLFKGLAEGRLAPEPVALAHLDHCLACRACERVCPAHVAYGELLVLGRVEQRKLVAAGLRQRLVEALLPRRAWLSLALGAAGALRRWLPGPWRRIPAAPTRRRFPVTTRPLALAPRGRVALFIGCLGPFHEQDTVAAAIKVLTRLGWQVDVPAQQTCCGATQRHAGADPTALMQRNRKAFDPAPSAVLTLASGCHETIAAGFAAGAVAPPVHDLLDFLAADAQLDDLPWRRADAVRVALHLPCTQRNLLRNGARVLALLRRVPGLPLEELPDTGCCGAAGSHLLTEPARADALRVPLLDAIAASGATTLCSANVGCRMHVAVGFEGRASPVRVLHPVQLLAEHLG